MNAGTEEMAKDRSHQLVSRPGHDGCCGKNEDEKSLNNAVRFFAEEILSGNSGGAATHVYQNGDDGLGVDNFSAVHPLQCLR